MTLNVRGLVVAAVLGVVALLNQPAVAGDHCYPTYTYKKVVTYKTVEEEVVTKVPYQKKVVKYDHCGKAYYTYETCYKEVVEVVCKKVPVVTWVKVCE